ncbi:MAG TPA: TolC family protein [Vicinamibacterales bacterium]|nr:TolC family protein [Vicinamibacterales bacterium]
MGTPIRVAARPPARVWLVAALLALPSPAAAQQAEITLTLDEAVQRALERNLDIRVERLSPQAVDYTLASLRALYHPTITSTVGQRSQVNLPTTQLNGGQRVTNDTLTYNAGIEQLMPWGGGRLSVTWNNTRLDTSNIFANFNPSYTSSATALFTQPLLRGFRSDSTRQQLRITRINRDISEAQLRGTIAGTLAAVRHAYWDLVFARQAVDVARGSLELAEKLVEDNQVRVEAGAMAPIDVVEAQAEAAARRQALTQAEAEALVRELALKQLLVEDTSDPLWQARVVPVDSPTFRPEAIDVQSAISLALERRTDLEEARRQLESADVTLAYLAGQRLPALDAVASYGLQGLGGTQFIREGSGLGSVIVDRIPGGYGNALRAIAQAAYPTWNVSLNVSYPLFGSSADAQHARAQVQRRQALERIKALELQVAADVTTAALQVQSALRQIEAATAARSLAERRLEAEQSKFEVGLSTNFFVVQAQRDLQDARNRELRALIDYQKALVDFERVQETSLQRSGIQVVPAAQTP